MEALKLGQKQKDLGQEGLTSWQQILENHSQTRDQQVYKIFREGIEALNINPLEIPSINKINEKLMGLTGWRGVFVDGLEDAHAFYKMLSQKQFPVGNFIRAPEDLSYTPEPDIVHDLYGHLPFFANQDYADFCYRFGHMTCQFMDREDLLRQFERFFWFTIEFGLICTPEGLRVFGAGIASSTGECDYALSREPEVLPFDIDKIRYQEFRIDQMQKRLFVLKNEGELYGCLDELARRVEVDRNRNTENLIIPIPFQGDSQ